MTTEPTWVLDLAETLIAALWPGITGPVCGAWLASPDLCEHESCWVVMHSDGPVAGWFDGGFTAVMQRLCTDPGISPGELEGVASAILRLAEGGG